jgi:hypothetical protein
MFDPKTLVWTHVIVIRPYVQPVGPALTLSSYGTQGRGSCFGGT